ncbi:Protein of unknown function [Gryllus bimaculatus]|nr:Protein of unknown function [Gryllus bimaculatus]
MSSVIRTLQEASQARDYLARGHLFRSPYPRRACLTEICSSFIKQLQNIGDAPTLSCHSHIQSIDLPAIPYLPLFLHYLHSLVKT